MEIIELTILMPCLNEAKSIAECIKEAKRFLKEHNIDGEILISDNGSVDGSQGIAIANGAEVICAPIHGYGGALSAGIAAAKGTYVIMADSDGSYPFSDMAEMLKLLREGADMVIGNRFAGGFEDGSMPFSHRYFGVPLLSMLGRQIGHTTVRDFHCGMRGVCREKYMGLNVKSVGMEYASEMILRAAAAGQRIEEAPIRLRRDTRNRKPSLRAIPDGLRHVKIMLQFWHRRI